MQTESIKRNIAKHVGANDYAGTVATIIDLQLQVMRKKGLSPSQYKDVQKNLETVRDELLHLQDEYQIMKRYNKNY